MANKPKRRFRRYLRGNIDLKKNLGTLAGDSSVLQVVNDTVEEKAWLSSVKATYAISEYTIVAGAGPILVGLAHNDYTNAEIEEWIENANSWSEGDLVAQEVAKRKIRRVGVFGVTISGDEEVLNDGKPITTKCGWYLQTGQTVTFFFYNQGSVALSGTDPEVAIAGHANLWPR